MTAIRETGLFFRRRALETLRQPTWLFMGLTTPLLYLAFFAPLLEPLAGGPGFPEGNVLNVFIPGILVLMAFGSGTGAGWIAIFELENGIIERFRVTPASRFALLLGTALRDIATFIVPAIVVIVVAIPFGFHPHPAGITLELVLLGLLAGATSATSNALGVLLKRIGSLAAIVTGLNLPLTLLSGILLPLSLAPAWMRILAHANPMYYAVEASRDLAAGTIASSQVALGFGVLIATALVALTWATRTYQRVAG